MVIFVMVPLYGSEQELLKLCSSSPISPIEKNFEGERHIRFNGRGKILKQASLKKSVLREADFVGAFLVEVHFEGIGL